MDAASCPKIFADRLDEGPGARPRELHARGRGPVHEPPLELLALDLDLPDLADGSDQLLQSAGTLPRSATVHDRMSGASGSGIAR